jgi:polysaccharide pyruvyl transferase WcaK-like protein
MKLALLDTTVCTDNLGDYIIMNSVRRELTQMFPLHHKLTLPTHEKMGNVSYNIIHRAQYAFIGGTNLLSSNMNQYNQWKVNLLDTLHVRDILLMGVGWWQYQKKPNFYTRYLFSKLLHPTLLHSVRDEYTHAKLNEMGFSNVITTGCPTMWQLTPDHCAAIPHEKSDTVVFTLTDYNMDSVLDQYLIDILLRHYKTLYFWVQGCGDYAYFRSLKNTDTIHVIEADLDAYDRLLDQEKSLDYVGTRLHAGIRALQKKHRSLIIAIDNRSIEISKNTQLPILARKDIPTQLDHLITTDWETSLTLPLENIQRWKRQFRPA